MEIRRILLSLRKNQWGNETKRMMIVVAMAMSLVIGIIIYQLFSKKESSVNGEQS